jgi:hypothetical protein
MKGKVLKSAVVQMIGYLSTMGALQGFQPLTVGLFIAIWCSRLIRFPAFPLMVVGIGLNTGLLSAAKYGLIFLTIAIVFYILEGKKTRASIYIGSFLGGTVLLVMELLDVYMSNLGKDTAIMAGLTTVLAISVSIVAYRIIEMLQLPAHKDKRDDDDGYKEKLNSYEEKVSSISDAFAKMARNIERSLIIDKEDAYDEDSQGSCEHCKALKRQNIIYKNKLKDSRRVIATQLQEIARILGESVDDTYDFHSISNEQMGLLTSRLRDAGIVLKRAVRLDNRRGISEIIVTMKAKRGKCVSVKEVTRIINLVFDKDTEIVKEKRRVIGTDMDTYRFKERPNFYVLHGLAKTSYDDVSGDNFTFVSLDSGQTLLGISDGMGTGVRAYKDSEMVLELIENLMESGFGEETTLKLVNTLFVLEGEDLSPATVDMSIIDMYSGVCDFLKLGAAATYVKRGDWVEVLRSTSLPIGGEECLDIESATKKLYDGDFVIMMSDGIIETAAKLNKEEEIGKLILEAKPGKPQEMADRILNDAIHLLGDVKEDDMTVFVTGIWNYGTCIA